MAAVGSPAAALTDLSRRALRNVTTTTQTRLIDNYIAGRWTAAGAATGELDVTNPATAEAIARVPLSGAADLDAAVATPGNGAWPARSWSPRASPTSG
jgi:hypothetical protein